MSNILEIDNVHKSFNGKDVLRGVSVNIVKGQCTALLGKSGEGKSVLVKTICNLLTPTSGTIRFIDGVTRKDISMVFQSNALLDSLTVRDNILLGIRYNKDYNRLEADNLVDKALEQVGLSNKIKNLYPSDISGGMAKRVAVARAVIIKPKILIFDEPTSGLDPISTNITAQLIHNVGKELEQTVLVITHDLMVVKEICDRVVMIHEGKVVFDGTTSAFLATEDGIVHQFRSGKIS